MSRPTFLAVGLTVAGSLACAHLLAAAILPSPPRTIRLELLSPMATTAQLMVDRSRRLPRGFGQTRVSR